MARSTDGVKGAAPCRPLAFHRKSNMTKPQIEALRREVEQMAAAGASRNEFREWADAYYFGMEDLFEVVKLMVDELDAYRQKFYEDQPQAEN